MAFLKSLALGVVKWLLTQAGAFVYQWTKLWFKLRAVDAKAEKKLKGVKEAKAEWHAARLKWDLQKQGVFEGKQITLEEVKAKKEALREAQRRLVRGA